MYFISQPESRFNPMQNYCYSSCKGTLCIMKRKCDGPTSACSVRKIPPILSNQFATEIAETHFEGGISKNSNRKSKHLNK